ncbi:uncharacterized protein [Delphinus delphis]|uniref:uncharacterized protein n=1 Tax=Delphinus delphis TaxID=9728 RepID=UPI003751CF06
MPRMQLRIWYWHGGFYATEQLTSLKASGGNTSREPRERSGSLRSILSAGAPGRRQWGALRPPAPADSAARLGRSERGLAEAVWPACREAGHWRPQPGRWARPGGPRSGGERGRSGAGRARRGGSAVFAARRGAAMSSRLGRDDSGTGGARRPREPPKQELQRRREQRRRRHDAQQLQQLKHLESFYEKPPPGLIKEDETKPEDCIPDVPGNEHAREFLAHAPTKGLWMPLGKEVKVMQC